MRQTKILLVDDEPSILKILQRIIKRVGGNCALASNAEEARKALQTEVFDLMLCDLYLPGESGMSLIQWGQQNFPHMGMIMISGEDDAEVAEKALEMGAYGYIIKPFKVNEIVINISNALRRQQLEAEQRARHDNLEKLVGQRTSELHAALNGVVLAIANTLEFRDPYTAGHQRNVGELARALAQELGSSEDQSEGIYLAGLIHDLGKIAVPAEILSKPSALSDIEMSLIKTHPQVGYDILKDITFPWPIADIVLQHHERRDGSGYPQGLAGQDILFDAQVLAVADVVEAMSSHRPYRPGWGLDKALQEVEASKGILFDSRIVDACLRLFREKGYVLDSLETTWGD
ncbi:MAG: HD domain-containing phosphohydrolase [Desulfovermiculus sp.]